MHATLTEQDARAELQAQHGIVLVGGAGGYLARGANFTIRCTSAARLLRDLRKAERRERRTAERTARKAP